MEIKTPLAADALLFYSMSATESLGRLFEYQITVLSLKSDIKAEDLLGKNVTVKVELTDGNSRYFDACVTRFGLAGGLGRYFRYQITGRPWMWLLTRSADCRIFQNQKVPDIIKAIFDKYPGAKFEQRLTGEYKPWEYCVQYRETDFNFVSRLMEQEGIYYYFKHEDGKHTVVLSDSYDAHEPVSGFEKFAFLPQSLDTPRQKNEVVEEWFVSKEIEPGAYAIDDYDFERPSVDLLASYKDPRKHTEAEREMYDWPGEYIDKAEGEHFVRTRLEELLVQHELCEGGGPARALAAGCLFKLISHPRSDQNREYLVTHANHSLRFDGYESIESAGADYRCNFTALPSSVPFRPARLTPKPLMQGPQTGVVVGPSGDEIYTDKYGRVKVQFHWDRYGKKNENSSCWIRVSHPWAGSNWGVIHIPRIGQEVIVDFLEGDPDCPIITGRVYNAEQMPPWELPGNKTQSGILTRSSLQGAAANANAIRFEDKKGSEQLWIHAEKNQDIEVENDETHWVGHDRSKTIDHDETTTVKHDRTETVGNNETITIGVNRTENVGNNETIAIGVNRTETVGANETITIGANRTISVGATETATVALQRTHTVGVNETIAIGAAQEIAIGAAQVVAVGAAQTITVGANQSTDVGANQSTKVGADQSNDVGGALSTTVGKAESRNVGEGRTTSIGKDDALTVGKNLVIDAADSVTIKTGSASITMKKDGTIVIKGKDITVEGSGKINVKASSDIVMKGSKILQN
ncbi:MAG TPA: type VI secretion system tip protein TssI/VgrG [Burkholderiaceae bacterium]|nr:type VI secretion system tip protein TssI/VgrG [Burkholderiaceae bacterium]